MPTSISTTVSLATEYVGYSYTGNAKNLRNCAGKTASASTTFDTSSAVFWVEYNASDGFAVQRSDYASGFGYNYPIWKQGWTKNRIINGTGFINSYYDANYTEFLAGTLYSRGFEGPSISMDNLIVGVSYYQSSSGMADVVYVASTTRMYASIGGSSSITGSAFTTTSLSLPTGCTDRFCLRAVDWYVINQIGVADALNFGPAGKDTYGPSYNGSEYRGIAFAPTQCTTSGGLDFRRLGLQQDEDADEEDGAKQLA